MMNQAIETKGLDHHILHPMQCHINGFVFDEVSKFLALISSETMHAREISNPFDNIQLVIIPWSQTKVNSYFDMRKPTPEEYED